MICLSKNPKGPDLLIAYFERALDPQQTVDMERHFTECAECRGFRDAWTSMDNFEAPEVSHDFDARLYARIAQEAAEPWWKRAWWRQAGWKPVLPLTAACAALTLALFIHGPEPENTPAKAKLEPVNIEQVEQALEDLDLLAPAEL